MFELRSGALRGVFGQRSEEHPAKRENLDRPAPGVGQAQLLAAFGAQDLTEFLDIGGSEPEGETSLRHTADAWNVREVRREVGVGVHVEIMHSI